MKLLLYSTKANKYERLVRDEHYGKPFYLCGAITENFESLNGKIVAECDFECERLYNSYDVIDDNALHYFDTDTLKEKELIERSCVSNLELEKYFGKSNGYAIHIKNLHIFDEPRELSEYRTFITDKDRLKDFVNVKNFDLVSVKLDEYLGEMKSSKTLEKAPQNMQKIIKYIGNNEYEYAILISIKPEWLCKILNKEKTIEVRRVVLKEMLK
jgi:predicted transcriptional regulator